MYPKKEKKVIEMNLRLVVLSHLLKKETVYKMTLSLLCLVMMHP